MVARSHQAKSIHSDSHNSPSTSHSSALATRRGLFWQRAIPHSIPWPRVTCRISVHDVPRHGVQASKTTAWAVSVIFLSADRGNCDCTHRQQQHEYLQQQTKQQRKTQLQGNLSCIQVFAWSCPIFPLWKGCHIQIREHTRTLCIFPDARSR